MYSFIVNNLWENLERIIRYQPTSFIVSEDTNTYGTDCTLNYHCVNNAVYSKLFVHDIFWVWILVHILDTNEWH